MMTQAFGDIFSRRDMAPSHQLLTLEGTPGASGMFQLGSSYLVLSDNVLILLPVLCEPVIKKII
jgi:hypothetical protein